MDQYNHPIYGIIIIATIALVFYHILIHLTGSHAATHLNAIILIMILFIGWIEFFRTYNIISYEIALVLELTFLGIIIAYNANILYQRYKDYKTSKPKTDTKIVYIFTYSDKSQKSPKDEPIEKSNEKDESIKKEGPC
jgi:hypothetical protein